MIYLDMDGVCVELLESVLIYNGIPEWFVYPKGEWTISKAVGKKIFFPDSTVWWRNLPETPWFNEMYRLLHQMDEICFLSSPRACPHSASGKILWLQDRLGLQFKNFLLTCRKDLLAQPDAILFDDHEVYCKDFINAGGKAIIVPSIGNSVPEPTDMVAYLLKEYERVCNQGFDGRSLQNCPNIP